MKLFQTFLSPFPARVRLLLYAKELAVELVEPPGFGAATESKEEYLHVNPMGRVPTLVLDDGRTLPESEVICEYLEDTFPTPSLRPPGPWQRAQVRLLTRICDTYVIMAMVPLFDTVATPRKTWDKAKIQAAMLAIHEALGYVEEYIGERGYAVGDSVTQADGVVPVMLLLACEWAHPMFGGQDPLADRPRLARYRQAIEDDPIAGRVTNEMRVALAKRVKQRNAAT